MFNRRPKPAAGAAVSAGGALQSAAPGLPWSRACGTPLPNIAKYLPSTWRGLPLLTSPGIPPPTPTPTTLSLFWGPGELTAGLQNRIRKNTSKDAASGQFRLQNGPQKIARKPPKRFQKWIQNGTLSETPSQAAWPRFWVPFGSPKPTPKLTSSLLGSKTLPSRKALPGKHQSALSPSLDASFAIKKTVRNGSQNGALHGTLFGRVSARFGSPKRSPELLAHPP